MAAINLYRIYLCCVLTAVTSQALEILKDGVIPLSGPGLTNFTGRDGSGYWDSDLGLPLLHNGTMWLLEGDVLGSIPHRRIPSAIGRRSTRGGANWETAADGLPIPVLPLLAESTVPAGAIWLPGLGPNGQSCSILYAMNVTRWGNATESTIANGLLAASPCDDSRPTDRGSAEVPAFLPKPLWAAHADVPLTNAAPFTWPLDPDGPSAWLYILGTGHYRQTPVYLARVKREFASIASLDAYQWWEGLLPDGQPRWSVGGNSTGVLPVLGPRPAHQGSKRVGSSGRSSSKRVGSSGRPSLLHGGSLDPASPGLPWQGQEERVGEVSAQWMPSLGAFVTCYFNYAQRTLSDSGPSVPSSEPRGETQTSWQEANGRARIRSRVNALPVLQCQASRTPWGPWSMPDAVPSERLPWFRPGWCCAYGGYVLPEMQTKSDEAESDIASDMYVLKDRARAFEAPDRPLNATFSVTVSLWVPYRAFIVPVTASFQWPTVQPGP